MSDRAALISAILEHPDEDTPRLIFADWLQEYAETLPVKEREPIIARAEFIRAQIEAAKLPESKRDKSKPAKRAASLAGKYEYAWRIAISELGFTRFMGGYQRGFQVGIEIETDIFAAQAAIILALEPAHFRLLLEPFTEEWGTPITPKWVAVLANNPYLRAVTTIKNTHHGRAFGAEHFIRFIKSPYLANVKRIELNEDVIGLAGVKALIAAPAPFKLEVLALRGAIQNYEAGETKVVVDAVKLIASARRFSTLTQLDLAYNGLGAKCFEVLLASTTLPRQLALDLTDNPFYSREYAQRLAERFDSVEWGTQ